MINLNALTGSGVTQQSEQKSAPGEIGQEDFLRLMVAQLRNQDPFSPMDSGEFLSQIAQLTTATGIQGLQQSFEQFTANIRADQALQAASLIGRTVVVESEVGYLTSDGSLTGMLQLPVRAGDVKVAIYAMNGERVQEIALGQLEPGEIDFEWDGKNAQGKAMPPGNYYMVASAVIDGQAWSVPTYVTAEVQSVALGKGGNAPRLSLAGLGEVDLTAVSKVR